MARIRTIKPEFWQDEKLATLPHGARLLFIGLLNVADDAGRLRGNPLFVRSQVFPYEPKVDVEGWLRLLEEKHLILSYSHEGEAFLLVVNFLKHQKISKPTTSKLPAPEDSDTPPGALQEPSRETHLGSGKGKEGNREQGSASGGVSVGAFQEEVLQVFAYWREKTGVGPSKPGKGQAAHIRARLEEGWSVEDLKRVADGAAEDIKTWPQRANHVSVKVLYRDSDQCQKFVRLAPKAPAAVVASP